MFIRSITVPLLLITRTILSNLPKNVLIMLKLVRKQPMEIPQTKTMIWRVFSYYFCIHLFSRIIAEILYRWFIELTAWYASALHVSFHFSSDSIDTSQICLYPWRWWCSKSILTRKSSSNLRIIVWKKRLRILLCKWQGKLQEIVFIVKSS